MTYALYIWCAYGFVGVAFVVLWLLTWSRFTRWLRQRKQP